MCPLCAAGVTTWLLAGGAGSSAVITSAYIILKSGAKKTPPLSPSAANKSKQKTSHPNADQ